MGNGLARLGLTLLVGSAGGGLATWLGLPGGWLLGALFTVAAASIAGVPLTIPRGLRSVAMGFAGLAVGAAIRGETLQGAADTLPFALLGMAFALTLMVLATFALHRRAFGASPETAVACSWPGNLMLVLASAESLKADLPRVSLVQTVRLFALVVLLPVVVGTEAGAEKAAALTWDLLVAILVAAVCTGFAMRRRMVGGEMFLSAAAVGLLVATGSLEVTVPYEAGALFQVVVGAYVGIALAGCRRQALGVALKAAIASAVLAAALTLGTAVPMSLLLGEPVAAVALAYAPGGGEAMVLLALAFQVDPGFVGIHHTVRLIGLTFLFPAVLRLLAPAAYQATGSR